MQNVFRLYKYKKKTDEKERKKRRQSSKTMKFE